jgi:NarL family two-component system response regulator LiaR
MRSQPERPDHQSGRDRGDRDQLFDRLPARQQRLLTLVAEGLSDQQIAQSLGEPQDRVKTEVIGLLSELGFETRTQAVLYVIDRTLRQAKKE